MTPFPTPHQDKLKALLENDKLPESAKPRIMKTIEQYGEWIAKLEAAGGSPEERIKEMVGLLNKYRNNVDVDLIFDSDEDFLYRQKGQLKLDNSVIEEFLPRLVQPAIIPELRGLSMSIGPATAFLSVFFASSLSVSASGGGLNIRSKDQDFAISKHLYIRTSHSPQLERDKSETHETNLAYVVAECKTNLDKTMFQEACATARDTKLAAPGARYYLLCEWLDMTPVSTATTDIDEVIILRKAKRLNSNIRQHYSNSASRRQKRNEYCGFLKDHPFTPDVFIRFIGHITSLLADKAPEEKDVLQLGYF